MASTQALKAFVLLPDDADRAILLGRVWSDRLDGPCPVVLRDGRLFDLSGISATMSGLLERHDLMGAVTTDGLPNLGALDDFLDGTAGRLLAPVDLQAVKAAGVTFADSMLERVIEEQARGDSARAQDVRARLEQNPAYESMLQVSGFSFVGQGENVGMGFIKLKDWAERDVDINGFLGEANGALQGVRDATIFVVNLPTVQGLGQFGGFDMYLQDRTGAGNAALQQARNQLLGLAAQKPDVLQGVRPNTLEDAPQLQLHVDRVQAQSMGLSVTDIYSAIQLMLAPVYVNDYVSEGRIKRVNMQADAQYRTDPGSIGRFYTPSAMSTNADGTPTMIPLSTVVNPEWGASTPSLTRYNGYAAVNIVGAQAPGRSSGEAMAAMEQFVENDLPAGFGYDWAGLSYQEIIAGNAATLLLVLSVVVVFLALAALYESWSIPVAVLLIVPLGILGAVVFTMLRPGLSNDIFFKIGMVTVIGLAAKNAILIVEFAVQQYKEGKTLRDATVEAANLRFRPILMTSFAFIMGVTPMALSSGAGANARHALATGVIGGMLFATFLGLLMIPVFFVIVRRMLGDKLDRPDPRLGLDAPSGEPPMDTRPTH